MSQLPTFQSLSFWTSYFSFCVAETFGTGQLFHKQPWRPLVDIVEDDPLLSPSPVVAIWISLVLELANFETQLSSDWGTFNFWALWDRVCRKFLESLFYSLPGVRGIICGTDPVYHFTQVTHDAFGRVMGNSLSLCGICVVDSWARQM